MIKYEVNSLENVDFSQFQDEFGNLIKNFEVVVYFKNSDGEWVEDRRFESGRSYYIVDGQLYNKCGKSLLPLNMDFDSETCGACYEIVEEIKETKKITNNEVLFTCKGIKTLSLHKQSYSDNTCFYSLQDWRGNFKLSYGSKNLRDILNQIIAEKQIHEKSYLEDNNGQVLEIYNQYMKMYNDLLNYLNETLESEQNKINKNEIVVNFNNIVSELETKNLKLCFRKNKVGMFIIDSQNNMYQIELYRSGSYLDQLIRDEITVEFNYVETLLSKNIRDWEKEIWDVSDVKDFIKRQNIEEIKEESDIIDSKEICKTYFKFDNKIINGWKVIECDNTYEVYVYTSCKALGNWQLFLTFDDKERMLRYFRNQVNKTNEKLENEWCKTEHEWFVNTYDSLNKKIA